MGGSLVGLLVRKEPPGQQPEPSSLSSCRSVSLEQAGHFRPPSQTPDQAGLVSMATLRPQQHLALHPPHPCSKIQKGRGKEKEMGKGRELDSLPGVVGGTLES